MRRFYPVVLVVVLLLSPVLTLAATTIQSQDHQILNLSFGTGIEFETGDYGTGTTTDLWKIPLLIQWAPNPVFSLSAEIPFVSQTTTGETVLLGGVPTPRGGRMGGMSGTTSSTLTSKHTESGLGDIKLNAGLTLLQESDDLPRVLGLLYAKLPTADENKGLGTGEFDWGGGLGLGRHFGDWSTYVDAIYIDPGTSSLYNPDPYWEWQASLSYRLSDTLRPGLALTGGTAPFAGQDDPLKIQARLNGLTGEHSSFGLYLARGLSNGSPDWGFGLFGYLDY